MMLIVRKTTAVRHQPRITDHCDDYGALVQGYEEHHKELLTMLMTSMKKVIKDADVNDEMISNHSLLC